MRSLLLGTFAFTIVVTAVTFETYDANAAVCGRGPYRAGCVGPRGAAVVGPGGAAVVGRRYGAGVWYGTGRRFWRGQWYDYGVGSCWALAPVGYVWTCR
jgi:hypothetical protein